MAEEPDAPGPVPAARGDRDQRAAHGRHRALTTLAEGWPRIFGIRHPHPPSLFRRAEEIDATEAPLKHAHELRRAFRRIGVDAILCLDGAPIAYFKQISRFVADEARALQRRVWNQGLASALILVDPLEVRIYSALASPEAREALEADEPSSNAGHHGLVRVLHRTADRLEIAALALALESGELFAAHAAAFDPNLRVERRLVKNLTSVRERLLAVSDPALDETAVNALLCRSVFVCYLVQRGIIDPRYFEELGAQGAKTLCDLWAPGRSLEASRRLLEALFEKLRHHFHGDLFDASLEGGQISLQAIEVLGRFLRGEERETGQLSFAQYDFSVIPIETINAIHERFLAETQPADKRATGIFYTPPFIAEVALDVALGGLGPLLGKRFLDPACGSGIFLVGLFHRLADEWTRTHPDAPYAEHADALIGILERSLFGVDQSQTACQIAAFSLSLALLDQLEPPALRELLDRGHHLPRLVFGLDPAKGLPARGSILCASFGQADPVLPPEGFDLVIGNPPWASRSGTGKTEEAALLAAEWPHDPGVPVFGKQLACRFVWKAPRHLREGGRVCFILPDDFLFNRNPPALRFQRELLEKHAIEQVYNLSDLRFLLFEEASQPALILRYRREPPLPGAPYRVAYTAPKAEWATLRANRLPLSLEDRASVDVGPVLRALDREEQPTAWKEHFWATARDRRLLARLAALPRLSAIVGQPHKGAPKRWIVAQGFQPEREQDVAEESKPRPWPPTQLFLDARHKAMDLLLISTDAQAMGHAFPWLRRDPEAKAIYAPPHVLVTHGMRVAYADFHVVFRHAVQGIHGPPEDADLLMFLTVFLRSALARYFLFHTAPNWGLERSKVHLQDLLCVPFPLPDEAPGAPDAKRVVHKIAEEMRWALRALGEPNGSRAAIIKRVDEATAPLLRQYFGVDAEEQLLLDDTEAIVIPSITPKRGAPPPALRRSSPQDRTAYAARLCQTLDAGAPAGAPGLGAALSVSESAGLGVVTLTREDARRSAGAILPETRSDAALSEVLQQIERDLGAPRLLRGLRGVAGSTLYLVKPLALRNWSQTAALNDADELSAALGMDGDGEGQSVLRIAPAAHGGPGPLPGWGALYPRVR